MNGLRWLPVVRPRAFSSRSCFHGGLPWFVEAAIGAVLLWTLIWHMRVMQLMSNRPEELPAAVNGDHAKEESAYVIPMTIMERHSSLHVAPLTVPLTSSIDAGSGDHLRLPLPILSLPPAMWPNNASEHPTMSFELSSLNYSAVVSGVNAFNASAADGLGNSTNRTDNAPEAVVAPFNPSLENITRAAARLKLGKPSLEFPFRTLAPLEVNAANGTLLDPSAIDCSALPAATGSPPRTTTACRRSEGYASCDERIWEGGWEIHDRRMANAITICDGPLSKIRCTISSNKGTVTKNNPAVRFCWVERLFAPAGSGGADGGAACSDDRWGGFDEEPSACRFTAYCEPVGACFRDLLLGTG